MELAPTGEARFHRPDGRPLADAPTLPELAGEPVITLAARLASGGMAVEAGAPLPDWWGGAVDYNWEIDWLLWRNLQSPASAAG